MGVIAGLARRAHATSGLVNPQQWMVDFLGGGTSSSGVQVDEFTALTSAAVYACVKVISETISSLPLQVYQDLGDKGKRKASDHPVYALLHDQPNPEMTSVEWREATTGHLLLWGNSYSEIERDVSGRPIALWPLRPDRMQIYRDPETLQLDYQFSLWRGGTAHLKPEQVLHTRLLSRDGILGLSPVQQMKDQMGWDIALTRFGGKFFAQGATMSGVLVSDKKLQDAARENLKKSFAQRHEGLDNAHRIAILEDGVSWQATGMSPEAAQFLASRTFSLNDIARAYRVPPHLLQELMRSTNNNIEHQGLDFVIHTIRPYCVRFEQRYQTSLFGTGTQFYARHNVDGLLRGDLLTRYQAYAIGKQWGFLNSDEIREKEDMNPIPDGDGTEYLRPLNMVPAGTPLAFAPPKSDPGAEPDAGATSEGDQEGARARREAMRGLLEETFARIARRERQDLLALARKTLAKGDREGFVAAANRFYADHIDFALEQLTRPVAAARSLGLVDRDAASLAVELRNRGTAAIGRALESDVDPFAMVEAALSEREATFPGQLVDELLAEPTSAA